MADYYLTSYLFLFFFNFLLSNSQNLQTSIPCDKNSNSTLCHIHRSNTSETCVDLENNSLTTSEKDLILKYHTSLRESVQDGKYKLPKAFFLKKLHWNKDLEVMAQKWAEKCVEGKDTNLYLEGKPIGQNLITVHREANTNLRSLINNWEIGLQNLTEDVIEKYRKPKQGEIDYEPATQMIWWNTTQIGCGKSIHNVPNCTRGTNNSMRCLKLKTLKLVCNYFPAGNKEGDPVYIKSENNNLICQYDDEHVLCKNISSRSDIKIVKHYDNDSILGRIRNRMNGIWPTAGRASSISSNSYLIFILLLKSFVPIIMYFYNEMFIKSNS